MKPRVLAAAVAILAMLSLHCSGDAPLSGSDERIEFLRLFITEESGTIDAFAIDPLDPGAFEKIDDLGENDCDFATLDSEYYDVYFSTALGEPLAVEPRNRLPEPIYITVRCLDLGSLRGQSNIPLRWEDSGHNIDALSLTTRAGTMFGRQIVNIRYGECGEDPALNEWPASNALGPPDKIVTHLGGGFSSVTIRMDFIMMGALTLFEQSNSPSVIYYRHVPNFDTRLFEKLPELTQETHDFASADCELFDIYFSDAGGAPVDFSLRLDLPVPLYLTIDCLNLNCDTLDPDMPATWSEADWHVDAVRLSFGGWHRFGRSVARAVYGDCGQLPVSNLWPAENILGAPDSTCSRMGGGFSSVTVQLADSTS